jgi:phosphoglycerate dehydrogenase-like enzyme
MPSQRILVTPRSLTRSGHPALARLAEAGYEVVYCTPGQQPEEEELLRLLPGCAGYLAGVEKISARVLESAPELRVISRNGTGVNNIDCGTAARLKIAVCRADGANARGVAELTIALMLALVRHIPLSDRRMKAGLWERREGIELGGRCLGVVGCGRIGQLVAEMAIALGMRVVAYDPCPRSGAGPHERFHMATSLQAVLREADVLSLHCPPPDDGRPLLTRERIALLKHGAYLINTARGELLDDDAVLEALDSGQLSGAAIDAYRQEPPGHHPLVRHENAIAVPHIGAFSTESIARAVEAAVDNLLQVLAEGSKG